MYAKGKPLPADAVQKLEKEAQLAGCGSQNASLAAARAAPQNIEHVEMTVKNGSLLAISTWPIFRYQPQWSLCNNTSVGKVLEVQGSRILVAFDAAQHRTPPMAWNTTFLNALWPLPIPAMPPFLSIEIKSKELKGWIDLSTGEVDFSFVSDFGGMAMSKASNVPALQVTSRMTSESLQGIIYNAVGLRLQNNCTAKLVAISRVPVSGDKYQDWMLSLPTDALSVLNVKLRFKMKGEGMSASPSRGKDD